MKSILDPTFRYTPSVSTDIRKTFAKARRQQARDAEAEARDAAEAKAKLATIFDARRRKA